MRPLAGGDSAFQHGGWKSFEAQTGPTGTVTGTRQYDAFGAQLASTGAWQGALAHGGGFGYQSDDTGLQLLGHRYYDPSIGRFLTRDPIKDGPNWYAYCLNDPVNGSDPTGLQKVVIITGYTNSWWDGGQQERIVGHLNRRFENAGYTDISQLVMPTKLHALQESEDADGIVIIAHGTSDISGPPWDQRVGPWHGMGTVIADGDDAWNVDNSFVDELRGRRRGKPLRFAWEIICYSDAQSGKWHGTADEFRGYGGGVNQWSWPWFSSRRAAAGGGGSW